MIHYLCVCVCVCAHFSTFRFFQLLQNLAVLPAISTRLSHTRSSISDKSTHRFMWTVLVTLIGRVNPGLWGMGWTTIPMAFLNKLSPVWSFSKLLLHSTVCFLMLFALEWCVAVLAAWIAALFLFLPCANGWCTMYLFSLAAISRSATCLQETLTSAAGNFLVAVAHFRISYNC